MEEEWRQVIYYCGDNYEVSSLGNIRSKNMQVPSKYGTTYFKAGKLIKLQTDKDGYLRVCLCLNGLQKLALVHRVVASAFIDNPKGLPAINHLDFNRKNNQVSNLEWTDTGTNCRYSAKVGRYCYERTGRLGWNKVEEIRTFFEQGASIKELAFEFKVLPETIINVLKRVSWKPEFKNLDLQENSISS